MVELNEACNVVYIRNTFYRYSYTGNYSYNDLDYHDYKII